MLVYINPSSNLVRFDTEVLESFKYGNDLLEPLLCWTHQKLKNITKKMTYGGCQRRLVLGFPKKKGKSSFFRRPGPDKPIFLGKICFS